MSRPPFALLAPILRYPTATLGDDVAVACAALESAGCLDAAGHLRAFAEDVRMHSLHELQERYAHTFDFSGDTTLETGWHLFGEQYARGIYMAKVRGLLVQHGISEEELLPDNLLLLLLLLARLPDAEADDVIHACILPACTILRTNLEKALSPYALPLRAVEATLAEQPLEKALAP